MAEARRCAEVREVIPEFAMGVASGEVRARALAHLAECAECRRELEDVTATVDELLMLAPEHEPPPGFDARVMSAMAPPEPARRGLHVLLAAAAAVAVAALAAGLTYWHDSDDRDVADQYREALSVADGSYLQAADLTIDGTPTGNVFAYEGSPSWMFVTVDGARSGSYHVQLVKSDGHTRWIGICTVRNGSGSWGTTVDVPMRSVDRVEMFGEGLPTMTADLPQ